jgi:hypothetical protein
MSSYSIEGLRPVFVVGYPRSGTTLTQQIVSAHREFWTVPETYVFADTPKHVAGWESRPLRPIEVERILSRVSTRAEIVLPDDLIASFTARAAASTLDAAHLLDDFMNALKPADSTATRWVEKTPQHSMSLTQILGCFPDARIIYVMRDPRSSISSRRPFVRFPGGQRRLMMINRMAEQWLDAVAGFERHRSDPRMILVRYEDIVTQPEIVLATISTHIGVASDMTVLHRFNEQFDSVTNRRDLERKALNNASSIVDRRNIWRQRLNAQEARLIETLLADEMRRYGYVVDSPPEPALAARIKLQAGLLRRGRQLGRNIRRLRRAVAARLRTQQ